jgi:ATP-dependent DNA helicase RecG
VVIDLLYRNQPVWGSLRSRLAALEDWGVVERIGRGRGVRYLLSQKFYSEIGRAGTYTRRRGLSQDAVKELLLDHIRKRGIGGAQFREFQDAFPHFSRRQIQFLLAQLRDVGLISVAGDRRRARWHAVIPAADGPGSGDG